MWPSSNLRVSLRSSSTSFTTSYTAHYSFVLAMPSKKFPTRHLHTLRTHNGKPRICQFLEQS